MAAEIAQRDTIVDRCNQLAESLGCPADKRDKFIAALACAEFLYEDMKPRESGATVYSEIKEACAELLRSGDDLSGAFRRLSGFQKMMLSLRASSPPFNDDNLINGVSRIEDDPQFLVQVAEVQASVRHRGNKAAHHIKESCNILGSAYYAATGKRPTHTPEKKTHYTGEPQSPFGRFVIDFFKTIDPSLKPHDLTAAVAFASKRGRARSRSSSRADSVP